MLKSKILYWMPLSIVIAVCAITMVLWAFIVPVYESPDELHHWKYAQYIHSHLALPPYTTDYLEAPQPPLYYLLIAPLASSMRPPPILQHPEFERIFGFHFDHLLRVHIDSPCWPHLFANCPGDSHRYWPIRRARLVTITFGLIAVVFTALAVFEVTKSRPGAVMAAALIGFLPQFDFRSASVNNDPALVCFSAIATYFIVRMIVRGFEIVPAVCGSVAIALAFLSKISAAVLVPVFAAAILLTAPNWRTRFQRWAYLFAICGFIVLPWLIWNKWVYGDILASSKITQTVPLMVHKKSITDPYFRTEFLRKLSQSFFGYFGWLTLKLPRFIYQGYAMLYLVAWCGLLFSVPKREKLLWISLLMAATALGSLAFLAYANLMYEQPQGRLIYQSLSAIVVLVALGLGAIPRISKYVAAVVVIGLFSVNIYALTEVVHRAYSGPQPLQTSVDVQIDGDLAESTPEALLPDHSYTQSFIAEHDNLTAVEVEVILHDAVKAGGTKQGSFHLSLSSTREGPPLASVQISADAVAGSGSTYLHLGFLPIPDSAQKKYFISLTPQDLIPAGSYILRLSKGDSYPDGTFFVDGRDTGADTVLRTFYNRPCWTCPLSNTELDGPLE